MVLIVLNVETYLFLQHRSLHLLPLAKLPPFELHLEESLHLKFFQMLLSRLLLLHLDLLQVLLDALLLAGRMLLEFLLLLLTFLIRHFVKIYLPDVHRQLLVSHFARLFLLEEQLNLPRVSSLLGLLIGLIYALAI